MKARAFSGMFRSDDSATVGSDLFVAALAPAPLDYLVRWAEQSEI